MKKMKSLKVSANKKDYKIIILEVYILISQKIYGWD
jgi:hypothetical protein